MKLVVAVVRDEYAAALTEQLAHRGFGATKLASTGGFLRAGNTTFLVGVPEAQLDEVMSTIKQTCTGGHKPVPVGADQVPVAGATVFVLPVERMIKA
jgi:uncharacterized protein YaaQ